MWDHFKHPDKYGIEVPNGEKRESGQQKNTERNKIQTFSKFGENYKSTYLRISMNFKHKKPQAQLYQGIK